MRLFVDCPSTNNLIYEHYLAKFPSWVFVDEIVRRLPIYEQSHLRTLLSEIYPSLSSLPLAVKKKKKNSNRKRKKKKDGVRR